MSVKLVAKPLSPGLHTPTKSTPGSPKSPSIDERIGDIREGMELGSGRDKSPLTSPKRPPRKSLLKESPRSELAESLESQSLSLERVRGLPGILKLLSEKQEMQPFPITVKAASLLETTKPCTRSDSRRQQKEALAQLINGCEARFFECARVNSTKKETLTFAEFKPAFCAFRNLLLELESKEFLDFYIVKNSHVGVNKDPKQREVFEAFHAKIFELRDELEKIGINSLEEGGSVNFWSGREGQQRAADDTCSFSDSDIPLLKFLFDCWGYIKNREIMRDKPDPFLTSMLPNLFSAIFASYAKGEVNVYMSSKNDPTANGSIINIDSAFWSAELYHLTNNENVTKVNLYLHIEGDRWAAPIDLKSTDPAVVAYKHSIIHISKRGDASLQVPTGTLVNISEHWRNIAAKNKLLVESEC